MKVNSGTVPVETPGAEKKINKKPQLGLDTSFKKTRTGLELYIEKPGAGETLKKGDKVRVHYEGWLAEDYTMFDSSRKKHRPFEFVLGEGQVIPGWDEALAGVRAGARLQLKIPAHLAYGTSGLPQLGIPANAALLFKVEVLRPPHQQGRDGVSKNLTKDAKVSQKLVSDEVSRTITKGSKAPKKFVSDEVSRTITKGSKAPKKLVSDEVSRTITKGSKVPKKLASDESAKVLYNKERQKNNS